MNSEILDDRFNNLVVLLFGCSEIRPRQVLQLCHDPTVYNLAIGVFLRELESSLDKAGHQALDRDQEHFFIIVEWDALHGLVLPDLRGPVLVALYFRVLIQMCQHDYQRYPLLVDHSPKVFNR